jgi:molybdopterin molybdotransferase
MLAALGYSDALVFPRPRVAVITTGNELVDPGLPVPPGCIRDSNRYSLAAQVHWSGACVGPLLRASDEERAVEQALRDSAQADLILTSGGVSVGDFDLVKDCLAEAGRIHFSEVAIRPGKPLVFGEIAGKPVFGLPGNPVSSMVAFEVFVRPALDQMRGLPPRPRAYGRLGETIGHKPERRTYLRARARAENGDTVVYPVSVQGTGQISSLMQANTLAIIPEGRDRVESGEVVEIVPLWPRGVGQEAFQLA